MRALVFVPLCTSLLIGGGRAFAAAADTATALFQEGVQLMQKGRCEGPTPERPLCEEARARFDRAFALYPEGLGALRNRAFVDRGLGRWRAARDGFRELEQRARVHENPERRAWADFAHNDAEALERRIPTLTVEVPDDLRDGAVLALDGDPLPRDQWGKPLERDPGEAELVVSRQGDIVNRTRITLEPGTRKTIVVALSGSPVIASNTTVSGDTPAPRPRPSQLGPIALVGAGAAITSVGLVLGYLAIRKHDEVCDADNLCDPQGLDDGRRLANVSTIVTTTGAAALAGGALWWWWRARNEAETASVAVTPVLGGSYGLALQGRF